MPLTPEQLAALDAGLQALRLLHEELEAAEAEDAEEAAAAAPKTRRSKERPDYKASCWYKMLEDGRCRVVGSDEYKLFRRRFGISFERFRDIVQKTR